MARRLNRSKKTAAPQDDSSDEHDAVDDSSDEHEAVKPPAPKKKRRAKKAAPEPVDDDEGDDDEPAPVAKKKRRAKKGKNELALPGSDAAVLFDGVAGALGEFEDDARLGSEGGHPYLAFYQDRMNAADDIANEVGEMDAGDPVLYADGHWFDAGDMDVMILAHFPYWATLDQDTYRPDEIRLTPQPFDPEPDGFKKNVLAVVLMVPKGSSDMPDELAPAIGTLTTFRSAFTDVVKKHVGAVKKTTQSGWVKRGGEMEKSLASWPKNFRIASHVVIKTKSSQRKKGRTYVVGEARPHTLTVDQAKAVHAYLLDADCKEQLADLNQAFESQCDELTASATDGD